MNIISNGIKYHRPEVSPIVNVQCEDSEFGYNYHTG